MNIVLCLIQLFQKLMFRRGLGMLFWNMLIVSFLILIWGSLGMVDGKYINNDAEYIYVIPVVCNGAYNSCFVVLNESHFLGHRIGYRCKCWFGIDRIVDDWDEVHWSCVPEEFRECIESEFFEIDLLRFLGLRGYGLR